MEKFRKQILPWLSSWLKFQQQKRGKQGRKMIFLFNATKSWEFSTETNMIQLWTTQYHSSTQKPKILLQN